MVKQLLFFIILFFNYLYLFSIENSFSYITPEDGLSQGNIACIYQDHKGFIWFGTFNGLNRFDGYSIKVFNHDITDSLSLGHEHIKVICEDDDYNLLLGSYGAGISVFYTKEGHFRSVHQVTIDGKEIILRNTAGLQFGPDSNIWYADETEGLFIFDKNLKLKKHFTANPSDPKALPSINLHSLLFDKDGNCWIGSGNGGLSMLPKNSESFQNHVFETRTTAVDDGIRSMYIDMKGIIWIGTTSQGAYSFNPKTQEFKNIRKGTSEYDLTGNTVMAFCENWDGNLMIGIDGGGINIMDQHTGKIDVIRYDISNPQTLSTNAVYALLIDRSQTLWVGTYAGGVNFIGRYRTKFKTYKPEPTKANSLSYKNAKCVLEDSDGEIWIGTDGGGLNKFNPFNGEFKHYRANPNNPAWLQTDVIIHMMQDNDGDIYLGSYSHGLTIFNKHTETFKQYVPDPANPNSIKGMHPWYIFQDSYGEIWVGMLAVGLDKFDKKNETFKHYISIPEDHTSLNSPNIKVIYEDSQKRLWIGTEGGGLHLYNREKDNFVRYFNHPENLKSISNNDVRAIFEDKKGHLWIGTGFGLNLMNTEKGTFKILTEDDGLPGNTINDILEDLHGNLWISTNMGISKFNPDKMTFRNYDITDGLQGNEFNYTAAMVTKNGEFYFAGKNGFNVFNPDGIKDNTFIPEVVLTDFQLFNKSIDKWKIKEKGKKVYRTISELEEIRLTHKENVFNFEFAALDFGNPKKNNYKYKLEGFDKEWNEASSDKRFASYSNLKGGKYTFRVIASNSDNVWNEKGLAVKLIVTPPFWKRTWFILFVILIITYIIYLYIKNKRDQVKRDKQILEERIKAGLEEVEKQKLEVAKKDQELERIINSEKEQNWVNTGLGKVGVVISKNKDNLNVLSRSIIVEYVEYLGISQGAIYLYNDDDETHPNLQLTAAYAPDDQRIQNKKFELNEGLVGACYTEHKVLKVDNLPEGYAKLTSGLGENQLKYLALVPLRLDEIIIGVVELLSFNPIEDYKVKFIEQTGETLTSLLTALRANEKTKKILDHQKILTEELTSHEEEMRQNLEEMQATQEDVNRKMDDLKLIREDLEKQVEENKELRAELDKLKNK